MGKRAAVGAVLTPLLAAEQPEAAEVAGASTLCGACFEACPVAIDIPEVLVHLRGEVVRKKREGLLGRLGGRNVTVEEYVMLPHAEAGAGALETLYIEIRHGRGPVDPVSWFGSGNEWEDDR